MVGILNNFSQVKPQGKVNFGNNKVLNNNSKVLTPAFKGAKDSLEISSKPSAEPVNIQEFIPRLKKASQFMQDFAKILEQDQQRETPVLKRISKGAMDRIFKAVLKGNDKQVMMGVSGGSASGKTTVSKIFVNNLNEQSKGDKPVAQLVSQDNYYFDFSDEINEKGAERVFKEKDLDCPQAVDLDLLAQHMEQLKKGKEVKIPEFLINGTGIREDNKITVKPTPLTVVEGLFTLGHEKLNQLYDLRVFVDASKEVRADRWWARAPERDIKKDEPGYALFNRTFGNHDKYVEPSKANADIVFNSEATIKDSNTVLKQIAEALTKPISFAGLVSKLTKVA